MLTRVAFGLAFVIATVSGSLAASHAKKSNVQLGEQSSGATISNPSEPTVYGWPAKDLQIFRR